MATRCWARALGQVNCQLRARTSTNLWHANAKCTSSPKSLFTRNWSSSSKRSTSPPLPPPKEKPTRSKLSRVVTVARWSAIAGASCVASVLFIGGAIFLHDAFTYTDRHVERVPVNPLALHPENGGPKDLPIARVLVGDEEDEVNKQLSQKPKLVIIGGGWGAMGVLKTLQSGEYHVTVISPETFTTFTPLLPSAAVGTVQIRSLIEPLRKIVARVHGHYICGKAVDLVMSEQLVEVELNDTDGAKRNIYVPYDKLIIACGSTSTTHGVTGLEHSFQLKTISDAQAIRRRIADNFEIASLPTTSPEERKRLLSFVICGGGPTGVETAAEIYDLCQEDILNYYPKLCREEVSINVIQSREHILNTYNEAISNYAEARFKRDDVNVITNARVKEITKDGIIYTSKGSDKTLEDQFIPANFVLWSTGIAMSPFSHRVSTLLPNQVHFKAIETDAHLRVKGAPLGTVYAVGDASVLETNIVGHLLQLVDEADRNQDGKIDIEEWRIMVAQIKKRIPMAQKHLEKIRDLFQRYDTDKDDSLNLNELALLLQEISSKISPLPATAQVAEQQGKYLGSKLSKLARQREILAANGIPATDEAVAKPFKYTHLGSLAYIGNAAVFDFGNKSFMGGLAAMYAWRVVYWSEQVSMRTRALIMFDWIIRGIWGRDLSRL
ncbi:nucleotide-binding domain-containing protein [Schizopora paradoxa]|uniref:Nucleotide-binding domain-containing protein n=1 Tax=Schizopora paradoxa TaxID=27342 RepID=A0A0H2RF14_9AGAM|nr:nucleotide-binding domain-containing protein [Schizopora paradoxa]